MLSFILLWVLARVLRDFDGLGIYVPLDLFLYLFFKSC